MSAVPLLLGGSGSDADIVEPTSRNDPGGGRKCCYSMTIGCLNCFHSRVTNTRLRPGKSHEARRRCLCAITGADAKATCGAFYLRVIKPTNRYEGQARDAQDNYLNGVNFDARSRWFSFLADGTT